MPNPAPISTAAAPAAAPAAAGRMQRAEGRARVTLAAGTAGRMRLGTLSQAGSAKAFLPKVHGPVPEVVFLNTAGGLTGGDRLAYALDLGAGARAVATTQTAERAYAAGSDAARSESGRADGAARAVMEVRLTLGTGAALDWLPQETILYEGAGLTRVTRADMAPGARLLMAEALVLGRQAMGETVARLRLSDRREVWRGGVPQFIDPFALTDAALDRPGAGPRFALLGGARALATVAFLADGAEAAAGPLRAALSGLEGAEAAVSGWDGRCLVRLRAPDGLGLRRALALVLGRLRDGAALPRVWQM
ncbi:urease accessory protein UreD [Frigidibacter sp. MR17.24]|uniref:urease accessory protein UreD n=1 Tax=Frigidibacter sp. MR17.24 TaxID=3127345 RepID=UPI003012F6EB